MISRQFLTATQHDSAERRAEAAAALARAYCHGGLAEDAAWAAKTAMLALLDDASAVVRRALAEACASSEAAPRPLIVALASDHPDIAGLVLARSPVLMDADLVDCAAMGCEGVRTAIAGRGDLSKPVAAALAEIAGAPSLITMAGNRHAAIGTPALLRMIARHGHDPRLREALLARPDLPIEARHSIAALVADSLASYGQSCGWLSTERGERVAREARDCAALSLADEAEEGGLDRLVAHLRIEGQLTAGLILRAILSLRMPFAEAALADLGSLSRARVAGLMLEPTGSGFGALIRRAGLPPLLLPAIQAALSAWREACAGRSDLGGAKLARIMIERALTACETMPFAEARGLMALLSRFEAEAARDEAREATHHAERALAEQPPLLLAEAPRSIGTDRSASSHAPITSEARGGAEPDIFDAVLDELPDLIVANYRAAQERSRAMAAQSVLDGLPGALMDSFLAGRGHTQTAAHKPVAVAAPARPRAIAVALAASMIPDDLVRRYRDDRTGLRHAA